jgi:homoserine O-acetyltransferase
MGKQEGGSVRNKRVLQLAFMMFFFCAASTAQVWAQGFGVKPEYFTIKDFKLKSGAVLPEMKVEYATLGTPKKDASGNIVNAVIWCHGWSGSYIQGTGTYTKIFGPGNPMDPNKFFIIFPTALGSPGSSSPSTSGLGPKFPKYTLADMVEAQYLLVTKRLGIKHLAGVAGGSMGGSQTLQWITQYPDMMDWAIPIATGPSTTGRNVGIWGLMSETIKADPAYMNGEYKQQPRDGLRRAFMGTYLWYFSPAYYQTEYRTAEAVMKGIENAGMGNEKMDANDIIWRNHAYISFNTTPDLPNVKAKVLVVGVNSDELFPPAEEITPIVMGIPGAKLFAFDSIYGHVANFKEIDKANPVILQFLSQLDKK